MYVYLRKSCHKIENQYYVFVCDIIDGGSWFSMVSELNTLNNNNDDGEEEEDGVVRLISTYLTASQHQINWNEQSIRREDLM